MYTYNNDNTDKTIKTIKFIKVCLLITSVMAVVLPFLSIPIVESLMDSEMLAHLNHSSILSLFITIALGISIFLVLFLTRISLSLRLNKIRFEIVEAYHISAYEPESNLTKLFKAVI